MDQDSEHLRLLSIFHYVVAGLLALTSCLPFIHVGLGLLMVLKPEVMHSNSGPPPPLVGWVFVLVGGGVILFGWILAILVFLAGRYLKQRRRRTFCIVVAALLCAFMPFGTVLGVFTLIVLLRPNVKTLFESPRPAF